MAILNKKLTEFDAGEKRLMALDGMSHGLPSATEITVYLKTSWHSQREPEALADSSCREIG